VAELILGEHDFSPFCVTASLKEDNRCRIMYSRWSQMGGLYIYEIRGNRFLHNMVRGLVGSLVNIVGKPSDNHPLNLTFERFRDIITTPRADMIEPVRVGFTAPAHGLYLVAVGYEQQDV
jgi:tRNA pseudouridine38-40 synthase